MQSASRYAISSCPWANVWVGNSPALRDDPPAAIQVEKFRVGVHRESFHAERRSDLKGGYRISVPRRPIPVDDQGFPLIWWARRDSNPGPLPCHGSALTN